MTGEYPIDSSHVLPRKTMKTAMILLAQYEKAIIPVEAICRDYFTHLTPAVFLRRASTGDIKLPVVSLGGTQKGAKGVHLNDLAEYLNQVREDAKKVAGLK
jgi:hypothetical protein